jgi:ketosteroid isomerase-like protein
VAFERARAAFDRGDMEAVLALFADDVEYVPPRPLWDGPAIHGRAAVIDFWRSVAERFERSEIENLALMEQAPARFVRRARLRHSYRDRPGELSYTIVQTTVLGRGRVVRQVNELADD